MTTGCMGAAHGGFIGICQVAPVCIPPNTCFLGPPESTTETASRSVQPFLHGSRVRVSLGISGHGLSPQNCPFLWRSEPPSNMWFLRSMRLSISNGISIGSAVFAQSRQTVPLLYNGSPFPQNCPFSWRDLDSI